MIDSNSPPSFESNGLTKGPDRGTLVLAGGGVGRTSRIHHYFMELLGGPDEPVVVIPTAMSDDQLYKERPSASSSPSSSPFSFFLDYFHEIGFHRVSILHTRDPRQADDREFVRPITEARGVWIMGGRQWRLADSYLNTRTQEELASLLDREGVIGGTSAGATILGSYLVRGDTQSNLIVQGDHNQGFGFISHIAVDQHVLKRNRQYDLIEILENHPELLCVGLDEDTALVVRGREFEIIGPSYVTIFDGTTFIIELDEPPARHIIQRLPDGERKFYLLDRNYRYDLQARKVVHWEGGVIIDRADA